jgi:hypothetical protein
MTQLLTPPGAEVDTVESTGLVGDRELVCVQTISIGRLRSDPVPISPSCFVAVGGRGPRHDSNGSGKTTFLGAVSLLLGDVGWRPAAGAPEAASLLFDGTKAVSTLNAMRALTMATSSAYSPARTALTR